MIYGMIVGLIVSVLLVILKEKVLNKKVIDNE